MHAGGTRGDRTLVWPAAQAGGPRLICVPGLGGSAGEWSAVGPALARHGRVIAVDMPVGSAVRADRRGGPLPAALGTLDRILASGAPEPSVLLGHSLGSLAAMLIAARQSHRLDGIVLTAPFVPAARHGRSTRSTAADYVRHRALFVADTRRRRSRPAGGRPTVSRRARVAGLGALARYGLRPAVFHDLADRVSCPVLLVHGSDDHYVPAVFARAAAARHPDWQSAFIAGAGHFPHRDDPARWLGIVDPWLHRLPPR